MDVFTCSSRCFRIKFTTRLAPGGLPTTFESLLISPLSASEQLWLFQRIWNRFKPVSTKSWPQFNSRRSLLAQTWWLLSPTSSSSSPESTSSLPSRRASSQKLRFHRLSSKMRSSPLTKSLHRQKLRLHLPQRIQSSVSSRVYFKAYPMSLFVILHVLVLQLSLPVKGMCLRGFNWVFRCVRIVSTG